MSRNVTEVAGGGVAPKWAVRLPLPESWRLFQAGPAASSATDELVVYPSKYLSRRGHRIDGVRSVREVME